MFADIASGSTDVGDVVFLVAAILFGLEALITFLRNPDVFPVLRPVALCLVAVGLLLL